MNIIDSLLDTLTHTDEWKRMQTAQPIAAAEKDLRAIVDRACAGDEKETLLAALYIYTTYCEQAALLYGIGVADTIRAAGADPAAHLTYLGD